LGSRAQTLRPHRSDRSTRTEKDFLLAAFPPIEQRKRVPVPPSIADTRISIRGQAMTRRVNGNVTQHEGAPREC
jgi:hypothetical protein